MVIKRFNISKPKEYEDKQGNKKTQWNNIGTITEFHKDGGQISRIIEIPAIGLEANIFEQQPKDQRSSGGGSAHSADVPTINIDEEIKAEDLPF